MKIIGTEKDRLKTFQIKPPIHKAEIIFAGYRNSKVLKLRGDGTGKQSFSLPAAPGLNLGTWKKIPSHSEQSFQQKVKMKIEPKVK